VVALSLSGIRDSEFRDCLIEYVVFPEVTSDPRCISGSSVRPRERPPTKPDVFDPVLFGHIFHIDRHLHVA
jgi:hypothetical protein